MAEGILGLGSSASSSLNSELINKLKEAEKKGTVTPLEKRIENIEGEEGEAAKLSEITTKVNELLEVIKPFDLFVTGGVTAFDQKSANVSGTSAVFDAADVSSLKEGTTTVFIEQLAKRDVFQSSAVNKATKDADIDAGKLTIAIAGKDDSYSTEFEIDTTGKSYDELADEINLKEGLSASVEKVGDDSFRLVIKSKESGLENALKITGAASQSLGYTSDGTVEAAGANVQDAQNLKAKVNGIDYNVSSNIITVEGGLKITAVEENEAGEQSTISVENDTASVKTMFENLITKYNELITVIDEELISPDSKIEDKASLRSMKESIKNHFFDTYGTDESLNIFQFGFELDKYGKLSLDSEKLNESFDNNMDDLKRVFLGVAEDEGIGTKLKKYVDELDNTNGTLFEYEKSMNERKTTLIEERDEAQKSLDSKYQLLTQQFAEYSVIITQFEKAFSGLQLMIQQSVAK